MERTEAGVGHQPPPRKVKEREREETQPAGWEATKPSLGTAGFWEDRLLPRTQHF